MTTATTDHDMTESEIAPPVHHDKGTTPGNGKKTFEKMLKGCIKFEASDLIVKVDLPPRIRVRGTLRSLQMDICTPDIMFQIAKDVLDEDQYQHFHHHGQIDFAYDYANAAVAEIMTSAIERVTLVDTWPPRRRALCRARPTGARFTALRRWARLPTAVGRGATTARRPRPMVPVRVRCPAIAPPSSS